MPTFIRLMIKCQGVEVGHLLFFFLNCFLSQYVVLFIVGVIEKLFMFCFLINYFRDFLKLRIFCNFCHHATVEIGHRDSVILFGLDSSGQPAIHLTTVSWGGSLKLYKLGTFSFFKTPSYFLFQYFI